MLLVSVGSDPHLVMEECVSRLVAFSGRFPRHQLEQVSVLIVHLTEKSGVVFVCVGSCNLLLCFLGFFSSSALYITALS